MGDIADGEKSGARRLLTVEELAEVLGVCRRTVEAMVARGRLPVLRLSRRALRFDLGDVMRALKDGASTTGGAR
jgi:excisionase family DNA binding protein